ncbi:unnamed protein product [Phaeothamnion confervicola]
MVTSLIKHERIRTTVPRAKALRRIADQMVTLAKTDTLHARRQAATVVMEQGANKKLFDVLGPRYKDRVGGYTRVMLLARPRPGDKADMAIIEYVDREGELRPAKPTSKMAWFNSMFLPNMASPSAAAAVRATTPYRPAGPG